MTILHMRPLSLNIQRLALPGKNFGLLNSSRRGRIFICCKRAFDVKVEAMEQSVSMSSSSEQYSIAFLYLNKNKGLSRRID